MEALLGLLTIEPMSGYDLGLMIRVSIGHFWNESYGQIYPNLRRLAADHLVECKTEKQKGKPDRHIYSITPEGRKRLEEWLAVEPQPEIPRNELLLKLFFGAQAPPKTLIGYVERMAARERQLLVTFKRVQSEEIARNSKYPDAPYWKMAARFGQIELEAHLRWAKETSAELNKRANKQQPRGKTGKKKRHADQ
jgi:PadR family transcriptional regulator, regulatory protein AphA